MTGSLSTWTTTARCERCLFYDGMRFFLLRRYLPPALLDDFSLDRSRTCSVCRAYTAAFDRDHLRRELAEAVDSAGTHGCLVAVSGGKDSLSTLYHVRVTLGLDATAVIFDNGFIPEEVMDQTEKCTRSLGVELVRVRAEEEEEEAFRRRVLRSRSESESPCARCSRLMNRSFARAAGERGVRVVFTGTNFFSPWWNLANPPSGKARLHQDSEANIYHLPYLAGLTHEDVRRHLDAMDARIIPVGGASSNCRVPAIVERRVRPDLGHVPELEVLALEVMVRHLPRQTALDLLDLERGKSAKAEATAVELHDTGAVEL